MRVNRGNLPAIKLGTAQVRLARSRHGSNSRHRGSVLKVGKYLFRDAFIQQLANGRWHVMRRIDGKNRYPIDVVKIPLSGPLTQAFEDAPRPHHCCGNAETAGVCTETTTEVMADPMKPTIHRFRQVRTGTPSGTVWRQRHGFLTGFRHLLMRRNCLPLAVWLSDAQYTGKMTDEDDWQAVLHIAVFIRAQAPDFRAGYVDGEHHFPGPEWMYRHFPDSSTP
ncbi:Minor tail protein Z (GPZ) of prophage [Escherichia coli]|nr:Minor tail protein Z (GPZ) of prophage [Escherichia coli]